MTTCSLVLHSVFVQLVLLFSRLPVAQGIIVEAHGLGFSIVQGHNQSVDDESVEIGITAITELGADNVPVGVGVSPSHTVVLFSNTSTFASPAYGGSDTDEDETVVEEVLVSAAVMAGLSTVNLSAVVDSSDTEINKETVELNLKISDWPFCTPFGSNGGRACPAEEQDILLEAAGALPDPPTPSPPHTLLIPRCAGDTVATLRFVCDPTLPVCVGIASVKFYLGEADQLPEHAPNTATIGGSGNDTENEMPEEFVESGVYEYNLTRAEVGGFLNVTNLSPGLDYIFWSVWEHTNSSAPESNSREFDLSRTQYWQCPGTTIARNFEVGTSLMVSFSVKGSTPLAAACEESVPSAGDSEQSSVSGSISSSSTDRSNSSSSSSSSSSNTAARRLGKTRSLSSGHNRNRRNLAGDDDATVVGNGTLCSEAYDIGTAAALWEWGPGGATFSVGEQSEIFFETDVVLDGERSDLQEGLLYANEEGHVTVSVGYFESLATYSALLSFIEEDTIGESSGDDDVDDQAATWVAIGFGLFLLWLLACCSIRIAKDGHAARTWPAGEARARARSKSVQQQRGVNSFGSGNSDAESSADVKELQLFPMAPPSETQSRAPFSPTWPPAAAPIAGWTNPGGPRPKADTRGKLSGPREAFPMSDIDTPPAGIAKLTFAPARPTAPLTWLDEV